MSDFGRPVPPAAGAMDPATLAVLANRLDAIVRDMTNTMLRTARSSVINVARDFSCSIVTSDDRLLASAEGLPVHIFGSHLQTASLRRLHPEMQAGDAFLDNDPYIGNSHQADHSLMVPVFIGGRHLFTTLAKAHHADVGNAAPSTYRPFARDCYEEGALTFTAVQVQRDYEDIDDIIRMCRRRIRVPDQWYGDYLAQVGAARVGERRLTELCDKYGVEAILEFIEEWFDYSERRMAAAVAKLPAGEVVARGAHDPVGEFGSIPLTVRITVEPEQGRVVVDLTDNPDCQPNGMNLTEATSTAAAICGVFNVLEPGVPHNAGSFRRLDVSLRENCVAGIPLHPTCCSCATTNVADRLVNMTQAAFADVGAGLGMAEGGNAMGVHYAVLAGHDWRTGGPFVNQVEIGVNGGPATPTTDGWVTWTLPVCAGLLYRDSVELDEIKYPIQFAELRLQADSGGPGKFRGGPAIALSYGPKHDAVSVAFAADGWETPPRGVRGGGPGRRATAEIVRANGSREQVGLIGEYVLEPGELIRGTDCSGGGYGDPKARDPERVRKDVLEGWVSDTAARDVYGVALVGDRARETLAVDRAATAALRR